MKTWPEIWRSDSSIPVRAAASQSVPAISKTAELLLARRHIARPCSTPTRKRPAKCTTQRRSPGKLHNRDTDAALNNSHHSNCTGITANNTPECEILSSSPTCILNPEGETGPYWVEGTSGRTCARTSPACPSSTGNSSTSKHVSQSRTCTGMCGTAIRRACT